MQQSDERRDERKTRPGVLTMWQVARTPRWIGALVFAFAVAGGSSRCSASGSSGAASTSGTVVGRADRDIRARSRRSRRPQSARDDRRRRPARLVEGELRGRRLRRGLGDRFNEPARGLLGRRARGRARGTATARASRSRSAGRASTPRRRDGGSRASSPSTARFTGRYLATEPPADDDFENGRADTVSVAALINQWAGRPRRRLWRLRRLRRGTRRARRSSTRAARLRGGLNWLNIFYAIEWVIFAGFAVFLWCRLVRDEWEREQELGSEELNSAHARLIVDQGPRTSDIPASGSALPALQGHLDHHRVVPPAARAS